MLVAGLMQPFYNMHRVPRIEHARLKLVAIDKYKFDKARGAIKDDEPEKKVADTGGKKAKPKFKNYGYVKKEE